MTDMLDATIGPKNTRRHSFYLKRHEWTQNHDDGCKILKISFTTIQCYRATFEHPYLNWTCNNYKKNWHKQTIDIFIKKLDQFYCIFVGGLCHEHVQIIHSSVNTCSWFPHTFYMLSVVTSKHIQNAR